MSINSRQRHDTERTLSMREVGGSKPPSSMVFVPTRHFKGTLVAVLASCYYILLKHSWLGRVWRRACLERKCRLVEHPSLAPARLVLALVVLACCPVASCSLPWLIRAIKACCLWSVASVKRRSTWKKRARGVETVCGE